MLQDEGLTPSARKWFDAYVAGEVTHFEALARIFADVPCGEEELKALVLHLQVDPRAAESASRLRAARWDVVVASAGCSWYIERALDLAGVELEVHANPGRVGIDGGLQMELPRESRYCCPENGIDKAAVVEDAQRRVAQVAFAGDGLPDLEAARRVPEQLRFARGDLYEALKREGLSCQTFERWSDVVEQLLADQTDCE